MVVKVLNRNISIVVISSIDIKMCSPFWLRKNNFISENEMKSIKDDGVNISETLVSFKTSTFDFLCDRARLQIQSPDITQSSRIASLVRDLLRVSAEAKVTAVGINAAMQFSFANGEDYLRFCHHCAPLDGLAPLSDNALLLDLTLLDWTKKLKDNDFRSIYNIKRLTDLPDSTQMAQISVNNHQPVNGSMDLLKNILDQAESLHLSFFDKSNSFIKGI